MYCTNCGRKNPDEANYCENCGAQIEGTEISESQAIPTESPERQEENLPADAVDNKPAKKNKKKRIIIGAAVAVVIIAGLAILLGSLLISHNDNSADSEDTPLVASADVTTHSSPDSPSPAHFGYGNTQGNIINGGFVAFDNDKGITYYSLSGTNKGIYKMDGNSKTLLVGDEAMYLNYVNGIIYYVNVSDNDKIYELDINNSKTTKLSDDDTDYLTYYDDTLYYKNNSDKGHLYSIKADGTNRTQLNSTQSDCPNVTENGIYYIDADNGFNISSISLTGENPSVIYDENQVNRIVYYSSTIYFLMPGGFFGTISLPGMDTATTYGQPYTNENDHLMFNIINGTIYFVHGNSITQASLRKAQNHENAYDMTEKDIYMSTFNGGLCGKESAPGNNPSLFINDVTNGKSLCAITMPAGSVSYVEIGSSGDSSEDSASGQVNTNAVPGAYSSPVFTTASASTSIEPANGFTYYPENALDGDLQTCWAEGVTGVGTGEWIEISNSEAQTVSGIKLYNGYHKNQDIFTKNGCPVSVRLDFSDGSSEEFDNIGSVYGSYQDLSFSPRKTTYIRITILAANAGSKYDDSCITDIIAY